MSEMKYIPISTCSNVAEILAMAEADADRAEKDPRIERGQEYAQRIRGYLKALDEARAAGCGDTIGWSAMQLGEVLMMLRTDARIRAGASLDGREHREWPE